MLYVLNFKEGAASSSMGKLGHHDNFRPAFFYKKIPRTQEQT